MTPKLTDVRVPGCLLQGGFETNEEGLAQVDIALSGNTIASIKPASGGKPSGMVFPGFVDCHTHIDKGHIWPRKQNPDGTFMGALESVSEDRVAHWSAEDVTRRMDFSLQCAYAHGTVAVRTHLDSVPPQEEISWPVFEEVRDRWAGRITLQAVNLIASDRIEEDPWFYSLADRVAAAGGILGAVTLPTNDIDAKMDIMFKAALDRGLELDFHVDETNNTEARTLESIADAAKRHRFPHPIMVGHCCSLALQPADTANRILDKVAAADISVVSLPMCNMYLQDRSPPGTTPRWRGVTLLHEFADRGVPVNLASDNTRDPFYAYGDLDMLEVLREAVRIGHLDHPMGEWPSAVAKTPAQTMGLEGRGLLAEGGPADLVHFKARSWTELLSRPQSDRTVIRDGAAIDATPPDYAELDDLLEAV